MQVRSKYQLQLPYIFYIGSWKKRKNIPFLIQDLAEANLDGIELVIAGGNDEQCDTLLELGASLRITDRLRLLGWVDDADLPALHAEAICFVYPSEYEGFGLKLCESMAVGCRYLAAISTCLPEFLGDGGGTFSLSTTTELANLLQRIKGDESYYYDLVNKAKKRSQNFNWQVTARQKESVYQKDL